MKKFGLLFLSLTLLFSCAENQHPKDYISFAGTLKNTQDTVLYITGFGIKKQIKINADGSFSDSLKVAKPDFYTLAAPRSGRAYVYLENGYDLKLNGDSNEFYRSFQYEGNSPGAQGNNFLIDQFKLGQTAGSKREFVILEKEAFQKKIDYFKNGMDSLVKLYPDANTKLLEQVNGQNQAFFKSMEENYDKMHAAVLEEEKAYAKLRAGNPAPDFKNYEDYKGGTKSLKDFRGNYVYIDIWATWCRPCLAQIPYLKKLEKEFEGKNISFVSISTDDDRRSQGSWEKAHTKWKKMVKDRNMSGIQLWAGKDKQRFSTEYMANTIPRFVLIDPEGKIVNHNEMRPSNPSISGYLTSLGVK
jgi:thiol-disulfide isomerase/thioredoxin